LVWSWIVASRSSAARAMRIRRTDGEFARARRGNGSGPQLLPAGATQAILFEAAQLHPRTRQPERSEVRPSRLTATPTRSGMPVVEARCSRGGQLPPGALWNRR
jgi:hypothetical protein